jgi:hypothetical protein
MIFLLERAREGSMAIFDFEATGESNVPVVIMFVYREKLENIHASIPFHSVCQKKSGLISGVTPEL